MADEEVEEKFEAFDTVHQQQFKNITTTIRKWCEIGLKMVQMAEQKLFFVK